MTRLYSASMANHPRYAIYYAPAPDTDLNRLGAKLLGYDAFGGTDLPFPDGIPPDWDKLTREPRKYGFHATLKAPMALADGKTEAELAASCESFARSARRIPVIEPIVDEISGFIAVIPATSSAALEQLAADCTREFDPFRAPLTSEERARRNSAALTLTQREHLDCWGYPYVMEDFRFHMTLTGRLEVQRRKPIIAMLRNQFAAITPRTLAIDRIALFRQEDANSRFRIVEHWKLDGN